jgi:hypothetical protein
MYIILRWCLFLYYIHFTKCKGCCNNYRFTFIYKTRPVAQILFTDDFS